MNFFPSLADTELLPVISKGLMAKHDRVQGEFIQILTEAITEDGRLGSLNGLLELQSEDKIEDEINFFDNMRHIQKHRRGRAMRRIGTLKALFYKTIFKNLWTQKICRICSC